jgi:hypothetical protein
MKNSEFITLTYNLERFIFRSTLNPNQRLTTPRIYHRTRATKQLNLNTKSVVKSLRMEFQLNSIGLNQCLMQLLFFHSL